MVLEAGFGMTCMKNILILSVVFLAACNDKEPEAIESSKIPAPVINNSGYKVHIDPATGEFLSSPPPKSISDNNQLPTASSSVQTGQPEKQKVVPQEMPGGGKMIELNGRFLTDEQTTTNSSNE